METPSSADNSARRAQKKVWRAAWYRRNRDLEIARAKAWAKANPERAHAISAKTRAKNREAINQRRNKRNAVKRAADSVFAEKEVHRLRSWRKANAVKARSAAERWRARNPERVRAARRNRYAANREKQLAATAAWRAKNPDRARQSVINSRARNPAKVLINVARQRAKKQGREFRLTPEWVQVRLPLGCALTGLPFDMSERPGTRRIRGPSIDRINSAIGYTPENCRLIFAVLNFGLSNWGWDAVADVWRVAISNQLRHGGISLHKDISP